MKQFMSVYSENPEEILKTSQNALVPMEYFAQPGGHVGR